LYTFREPSLGRQVPRELMRSTLLDVTPIIPVTACRQRNYVERYSRSTKSDKLSDHIVKLTQKVGKTSLPD
jgi:hypothetical protein